MATVSSSLSSGVFHSRTLIVTSLMVLMWGGSLTTWNVHEFISRGQNDKLAALVDNPHPVNNDGADDRHSGLTNIHPSSATPTSRSTPGATKDPMYSSLAPRIPHNLFFTYSTNLTLTPLELRDNVRHTVDRYRLVWNEPDAPLFFLSNDDCRHLLQTVYPSLIPHFDRERQGMYKGDVCRMAALYHYGGYYFDVDLRVVQPVLLKGDIDFSTCRMDEGDREPTGFFQAFLASSRHHPVLYEALRLAMLYYQGKHSVRGHYMGTTILLDAYRNVVAFKGQSMSSSGARHTSSSLHHHFLHEGNLDDTHTADLFPNATKQEGSGCCCNFIVHDRVNIYFYSRLPLPRHLQKHCLVKTG